MSPIVSILALAAGAAALAPADRAAIDTAVTRIFAPYHRSASSPQATSSEDYRSFSAETAALVARWKRVTPKDEVDDLSDGDWFCLCQDWDEHAFRADIVTRSLLAPDKAEYRLSVTLDRDTRRDERMIFRRERLGWRLDDILSSDTPGGLKQALRDTIAADLKLRR